jgi:uncharacterized protein YbaA (DUF1428 family)
MVEQTAVEWLECELKKIPFIKVSEVFKQAKAMEKEQTIKFAYSFYDNCFTKDVIIKKTAGEYYNETYNK